MICKNVSNNKIQCRHFRHVCSLAVTSFCVTVSMMVPKAGIVDILTELKAAGEQDNSFTIYSRCVTLTLGVSSFVCLYA